MIAARRALPFAATFALTVLAAHAALAAPPP